MYNIEKEGHNDPYISMTEACIKIHKDFIAKAIVKPYNIGKKVCGMPKEPY